MVVSVTVSTAVCDTVRKGSIPLLPPNIFLHSSIGKASDCLPDLTNSYEKKIRIVNR